VPFGVPVESRLVTRPAITSPYNPRDLDAILTKFFRDFEAIPRAYDIRNEALKLLAQLRDFVAKSSSTPSGKSLSQPSYPRFGLEAIGPRRERQRLQFACGRGGGSFDPPRKGENRRLPPRGQPSGKSRVVNLLNRPACQLLTN
jgi:hypothetical protein